MTSASNENFAHLTMTVGLYTMLTVIGIGIVTNLLNIRVCLGETIRKTTMGFYNLVLAPINISVLIISLFIYNTTTGWSCILIPYLQRVLFQLIAWINVLVSFDRLYLITLHLNKPNATRQMAWKINRKKLSLYVLAIVVVILCLNVSGFFYYVETQTVQVREVL